MRIYKKTLFLIVPSTVFFALTVGMVIYIFTPKFHVTVESKSKQYNISYKYNKDFENTISDLWKKDNAIYDGISFTADKLVIELTDTEQPFGQLKYPPATDVYSSYSLSRQANNLIILLHINAKVKDRYPTKINTYALWQILEALEQGTGKDTDNAQARFDKAAKKLIKLQNSGTIFEITSKT